MFGESANGASRRRTISVVTIAAMLVGVTLVWLWREHAPLSRRVRRSRASRSAATRKSRLAPPF
uniref:hypothetical protein n=1 Tax=Haloprofundus halobius TaxID=2876194 RepID=UPI001CC969B1|nr:hypothetical protein [Haloprofundus halobius]